MVSVSDVRTRAVAALCLGLGLLAVAPAASAELGLAPTRSSPGLAEVGAGLDFWLAEALRSAGLGTTPVETPDAGTGLAGAEGLGGALLPRLLERGDATRLELVWVDPGSGALLGSAAAEAPLGELGRAAVGALAELGPALGASDSEQLPPDLAALAAAGRAQAHAGEGELHAAWLALEGHRQPPADALRAQLILRARRSNDPAPERARLLAAAGEPEAGWGALGSRANLEVNKPRPDPALLVAAGEVQLARRNPRSAMRYLEAAERAAPDWIEVHVVVARARLLQRNLSAALESAQRANALAPSDPRPLALLAELHTEAPRSAAGFERALGDLRAGELDADRAQLHWQRAVELDPALASETALASARLAARLGRSEQALASWQRAADAGVDTPEVSTGLGAAQASLGRTGEAEQSLQRAVRLDPDHGPALERLGTLLAESDRAAEAVPLLRRAQHLQPESAARRVALAKALRMSGQSEGAVDVLISDGMPQDVGALRELAASQRAAGDAEAANDTLARAVELQPYDAALREHYAVALEASGDLDAAERHRALAEGGGAATGTTPADGEARRHAAAVDFDGLVASFATELSDPATTRVAMFEIREPADAKTWLRRLTRLREPDTQQVEAVLRAAIGARFRLVPLQAEAQDTLREDVDPLFDFDAPGSRSAEHIARVNTVLGTDGVFVTRIVSHPGDRPGAGCAPGTFALETRLLTGGDSAYVNLLGASDCVAGGLEAYGRWNVTAFTFFAAVLLFLVYPAVRGWGTLVVRIQLPDKTKGFFNIFVTTSPNQVRKEVVDKKIGRERLVARRSFDPLRRFRKNMAGREETFRLIPARRSDYTVTVGGPLLDARGEKIIGFFLEERPARVRRRGVTELDFDFRPRECAVEVRVSWQGQPAEGAQVAVAGDSTSLRYARDGQAFLYLGKGEYTIRVGNKKAAAEVRVLIESYENAVPLHVDLADCDALFRDCPEAVEPFLLGDYASAIDALEARGDESARRLRAELLEQRGQAGDAASELEAVGRLSEAAQLRATSSDHARSAELYEQAGDDAKAAAAYRAAGRFEEAGRCYERLYDYGNALECWREVGDAARELDLLEKLGEYFEAAELACTQGEPERAIHDLQQIDQRHPQYRHACRLIAEIVAEQGDCELAIAKYEESFAELGTEGAALDALESYAQVLERAARHEQALSVWEVIRRRDVERSDVGTRIQALRSQLEAATQAAASGAAPAPAAATGESRYELLEEIGRGGMGVVYKARDRRLGRIVALKRLPDNLRQHPSAVQLFEREARAAAALNHANIVTLFDAGEEDGSYFITMELLEGRALNDIVARHGRLSARDTARIGIQVAAGLHYAHAQRIVHRDIKTSNLFFTKDQVVKIMDFGIAKSLEEVRRSTTVVGGTPYYMAPEQATGQGVDHRADLYAFGVTIFQLCTGALPFSEGDVTYHHAHTPPPDPREVCMDVPDPLAVLILRMLAKRPEERPAHAAEVAETLRTLLGS